jgi:hypothetical protein
MLALYNASVTYITAERDMLGDDHPGLGASQNARILHFKSALQSMPPDIADSQLLMQQLLIDTPAFTHANRSELARTVSLHMNAAAATSRSTGTTTKQQVFLHSHNYMPASLWTKLSAAEHPWDFKLEAFTDFLLLVRCRNPSDASLKVGLAICAHLHKKEMTADDAYTHINKMKTKLHHKRDLRAGTQSLLEFPIDVSEFVQQYPSVYQASDPPIASRIDDSTIRELCRKDLMPTRNTNNSLKKGSRCGSPPSSSSAESSALRMCMEFMMGTAPMNQALENGDIWNRTPQRRKEQLAIEDGTAPQPSPSKPPPPSSAVSEPPVPGSSAPSVLTSVLEAAKIAIAGGKKAGGKKKKGAKAKKGKKGATAHGSDSEVSDSSDDDDAAPSAATTTIAAPIIATAAVPPVAHIVGKRLRRKTTPAAVPAAVPDAVPAAAPDAPPSAKKRKLKKKPAATVAAPPPVVIAAAAPVVLTAAEPDVVAAVAAAPGTDAVPKPSILPTEYNGGRLYMAKTRKMLRVYLRKGDKVEKSRYADPDDKKQFKIVWRWGLKQIDIDPRPRT